MSVTVDGIYHLMGRSMASSRNIGPHINHMDDQLVGPQWPMIHFCPNKLFDQMLTLSLSLSFIIEDLFMSLFHV